MNDEDIMQREANIKALEKQIVKTFRRHYGVEHADHSLCRAIAEDLLGVKQKPEINPWIGMSDEEILDAIEKHLANDVEYMGHREDEARYFKGCKWTPLEDKKDVKEEKNQDSVSTVIGFLNMVLLILIIVLMMVL